VALCDETREKRSTERCAPKRRGIKERCVPKRRGIEERCFQNISPFATLGESRLQRTKDEKQRPPENNREMEESVDEKDDCWPQKERFCKMVETQQDKRKPRMREMDGKEISSRKHEKWIIKECRGKALNPRKKRRSVWEKN
jgi:hypothetical protein